MGAEIEISVVNRRDTNDAHKNDIESIGKSLWVFFSSVYLVSLNYHLPRNGDSQPINPLATWDLPFTGQMSLFGSAFVQFNGAVMSLFYLLHICQK